MSYLAEAETREDIRKLPFYHTEDGKIRYIEIFYEDLYYNVYDEYERILYEYYFGTWHRYHYHDRQHYMTIEHFYAENCDHGYHDYWYEKWHEPDFQGERIPDKPCHILRPRKRSHKRS